MPHSLQEKKRVLARVRRLRGQLDALEQALDSGTDCGPVLQQMAAIRGAVNGLMATTLESHLREEFLHATATPSARQGSIDETIALVRSYLK